MSDNNEPLDLAAIEKWYDRLFKPEVNEIYDPWAKYIAALVAEVKRLRVELAEAKRTQVKDGGRGRLRSFPEPDDRITTAD